MPRRRNRIVWIVLAVVLAAGAYAGYRWRFGNKTAELKFETAQVDRGRIAARVTATGTLSALVTVQVGSQVSGRVQKILVDFNDKVEKGQLIAKIDRQLFEAALEQARANHSASQGDLVRAKVQALDADRQLARTKGLAERQLVAPADLDTAQATADAAHAGVTAAQGKVEQAHAALHQAQVNLDYTDIYSPISGIVISRNVDVGQTVAASLQAPTLFVLAEDLAKMQVDTNVAEADVGKLQTGMLADFMVDAYPNEHFKGKVRQVRNSPQTLQNVVTYDAVIDVDNAAQKLKPGMTANVTFVYAERNDVLRVPNAALRFRPPAEMWPKGAAPGAPAVSEARAEAPAAPPQAQPQGAPAAGAQGTPAAGPGQGGATGQGQRRWQRGGDGQGGGGPPDRKVVWVLRPTAKLPEPVRIKTGVTDGSLTEVVEGDLKEGDVVVTDVTGGKPQTGGPGGPGGPAGGFRRVF
jgi:HlyD family secretion protein